MRLRGGYEVRDPRLGRVPEFDDRWLAWLAGLLEGEAYFCFSTNPRTTQGGCGVRLRMTDEDVVRRVHVLVGGGSVRGPQPRRGNRQPTWEWALYRREDLLPLLQAILPYMGMRRGERIAAMIARLELGDGRRQRVPDAA